MTFIPDTPVSKSLNAPYFEDSKDEAIPGRRTDKSEERLQSEIKDLMLQLGASAIQFLPGKFPGNPVRYGYQVTFSVNGVRGRMDLAALPMHSETASKKSQALRQALYLFRNYLESEVWSAVYRPGAIALLPFLIGDNGKTITESLVENHILPEVSPYWSPRLLENGSNP